MVQTTISLTQRAWIGEGQCASTMPGSRISGALENAYNGNAGVLPFGRVTAYDPATKRATTLTTAPTAGDMLIVPILDEKHGVGRVDITDENFDDIGYPQGPGQLVEYASLLDVVMYSETAVVAGDPVYARQATAGTDLAGRVRSGAAAGFFLVPDLQFPQSSSSAGLVPVRVNSTTGLIAFA